jgi:hypothetical protein
MARTYRAYNGASPTTAQLAPVTTGTAIKTMLQIAPPATGQLAVVAWGINFDGTPTGQTNNTPIKVELIETDVAATVTAHVAAGLIKMSDANGIASNVTLGTTATGYTASAEGTTTVSRMLDYQQLPPTAPYIYQWPLGNYPMVAASKFLRVRLVAGVAVNAICWVEWAEGA